jgi:tripartite-type tricarboxylate transporter receptor subunit TctC
MLSACGTDDGPDSASGADGAGGGCGAEAIDFIVPYDPGGGTDTSARILAPELGVAMPGEPEVEVENLPGGAGAIGMNTLAAKDGFDAETLTIGITSASIPLRWITGGEGHDYPLDEMPLVGAFSSSTVYYVSTEAAARVGVDSAEDLVDLGADDELKMGHLDVEGTPATLQSAISRAVGIPFTSVTGYAGTGDVILAVASGEMDGGALSHAGYLSQVQPYVEDGGMLPLFQTGIVSTEGKISRLPALPDMPTVADLFDEAGVPREGADWDEIFTAAQIYTFAQGVYAAPGTSESCVNDLRAGFEAAVTSSAFVKAAEQAGADVSVSLTGEEAQRVFDDFARSAAK